MSFTNSLPGGFLFMELDNNLEVDLSFNLASLMIRRKMKVILAVESGGDI